MSYFLDRNQVNKPAIDAYLVFACGRLSQDLKDQLTQNVCDYVHSEGQNITYDPKTSIDANHAIVALGIDNHYEALNLKGEIVEAIKQVCSSLDYRFGMAMNSISGASSNYENSFAYNGVDFDSRASVWLSMGDFERKADLNNAITLLNALRKGANIDLSTDSQYGYVPLTESERQYLKSLNYHPDFINSLTARNIYITSNYITFKFN